VGVYLVFQEAEKNPLFHFFSLMLDSDMLFSMVKKEGGRNDLKYFLMSTHIKKGYSVQF